MRVSVVIPTKNEERNLHTVLKELPKSINEIIIVDGHSTDNTVKIAKRYGAKIIYENVGKGYALRKGMEAASGDIVIMMDADCSHRSIEIGLLVEAIKSGYDIAMGSRFIQGGGTEDMPLLRVAGNKLFVWLVNIIWGTNYSDLCYGYRAFRKSCIKKLQLKSDGFGIETEIAIKAAKKRLRTIEIPSYEKERNHGEAKLQTFTDGFKILKTILDELI